MKKLYTAPQSEKVNLDPLMVSFGDTATLSVTQEVYNGDI